MAAADDAGQADEPVVEPNEPTVERLESVPDTDERLDVAGSGEISVVTTRLTGALIGRRIRINNSAWAGYSGGHTWCAAASRLIECPRV